ncbi:hypothetical protein ACI65C_001163 [Semiaphis heraclei]
MTSDDPHQVGGPLQRCSCDYPQPPDADLITVAATVDSTAEAQRIGQQRQCKRDAEGEATDAASGKSFWKRSTAFVTDCAERIRRGAARLCLDRCNR